MKKYQFLYSATLNAGSTLNGLNYVQEHGYIYTNTQVLTHPCVPLPIYTHRNEVRYCNRMTNIVIINWFECNQMATNSKL
jgi:hypothetical protein